MLTTVCLIAHFFIVILLIFVVLLQKSDGDNTFSSNNSLNGAFTPRGKANILTRATTILMSLFIINCLCLARLYHNEGKIVRTSIINEIAKEGLEKKANQDSKKEQKGAVSEAVANGQKSADASTNVEKVNTNNVEKASINIDSKNTIASDNIQTSAIDNKIKTENNTKNPEIDKAN